MTSEQRREENRRNLMETAEKLFVSKGIRETSVYEIAEQSAVARKTLNNIFGTKDELVYAIFEKVMEESIREIRQLENQQQYRQSSGLEQMIKLLNMWKKKLLEDPRKLLFIEEIKVMISLDVYKENFIDMYRKDYHEQKRCTKDAVEKGIGDGSIRSTVDMECIQAMISAGYRMLLEGVSPIRLNPYASSKLVLSKLVEDYISTVVYYLKPISLT